MIHEKALADPSDCVDVQSGFRCRLEAVEGGKNFAGSHQAQRGWTMHCLGEEEEMTMPSERTRALIQTRDFLAELAQDPILAESIRRQARQLLRHYPHANEILRAGQLDEQRVDRLTEPFLSSSTD
ncbi:BPSL0761 family protein [Pseudomonas sp. PB120]|uniref:BPSL0761 family protein n=1 Tax=Pseudomonas sp. PB120 TaxID=2494700 RepID=UPI0035573000